LAQLARDQRTLLAGLLVLYEEQENLKEPELAALLGADRDALTKLALCQRPRMEAAHFRNDIERIADYAQVSATQLARLVRAAVVYEKRAADTSANRPILLAARDHETGEPEQKDTGEPEQKDPADD
jgi:hypothetical protein